MQFILTQVKLIVDALYSRCSLRPLPLVPPPCICAFAPFPPLKCVMILLIPFLWIDMIEVMGYHPGYQDTQKYVLHLANSPKRCPVPPVAMP